MKFVDIFLEAKHINLLINVTYKNMFLQLFFWIKLNQKRLTGSVIKTIFRRAR